MMSSGCTALGCRGPAAFSPVVPGSRSRKNVSLVWAASNLNKLAPKPELKRPEAPQPKKLFGNEDATPVDAPSSSSPASASADTEFKVTVEYQRQRAREMIAFFKEQKLQESIVKSQFFGWTPSNEIVNGRWVMFGFAVGMLTEYATGVDFVDQLRLLTSYLGIVDMD